MFNNLILLAIALVTMVITFWPVITETIYGKAGQQTFGADAYTMINAPLFLLLLFLMGVGPILGWRQNSFRQILRNFTLPTAVSSLVLVGYTGYLYKHDLFKSTDSAETITLLVNYVRVLLQVLLWPVCVFTFITVLQEFNAGALARKRGTGEGYLRAMMGVTLQNRRRYGGYIVHVGLLFVAVGMYYSSFYDIEGAVTAEPGGYAVLDDKNSRQSYLVYFDTETRTPGWDVTRNLFTSDEGSTNAYRGMIRTLRKNPNKTAEQLIAEVTEPMRDPATGELPPVFEQRGLPKMTKAAHWAVDNRDNPRVYEAYETTVRVFAYEHNVDLNPEELWKAQHKLLIAFLGASDISDRGDVPDPRELDSTLKAAIDAALPLGAELPLVLQDIRANIATMPDAKFREIYYLDASAPASEVSRVRTRVNEATTKVHTLLEAAVISKRSDDVKALALKLPATQDKLVAMRPLSLRGLREALKVAPDDQKAAIQSEIDAIIEGVVTVRPTMRIFYDKRDGMPRVHEPIKDPAIEKELTKDLYFVLMDVDEQDRARFRYFIKPHMTMGLVGLFIMVLGTAYALLPTLTRKRPEVA